MPAYPGVRRLLGAVLFLLATLAPARSAPADDPDAVRIGVLAFLGAEAAIGEWSPVQRRVQAALPGRTVSLVQLDHRGLRDAAAAGEIDFLITNPGHYVELEAELGASRILTLDPGPPRTPERSIGSAVIVQAGSGGLRTLADLRGKRLAVVSTEGFGGFQTVWRELAAQGIDPQRDLAELKVVGLPMTNVFEAVARGDVDAGVVRSCLLESREEWRRDFAVLDARKEADFPCASSTRLYPDWPLATLRHTPTALARDVTLALLGMSADRDGMEWAVPADYQAVHEMFRELQIGPYAYLREPTLMVLAERYWPWIATFALLLAAWILYTVRVEHLVHARTAELRAALAAREALEARIRANQEQADHLARLSVLGELAGTLAHELNQPLATIANYAQSLIRRSDNGRLTDDAVREASAEIAGQAERAAGILGRIRGFARKRAAVRERVAPGTLVAEAVALFRGMLANAPDIAVDDALPADASVDVDPLQIQQVLLNLLKNGYDAARGLPPERQRLAVRIGKGAGESAGHAHITVRDYGCGLDAAARERLFEPFFTTKPDGLGLGLSICRTIAEAHRGRLTVDGTGEAPGCEFILSLPLAPSASAPTESRSTHAADR
ncbi:sensor histidine kinase [Aromatoleum petrolei]|uniref:histidine kinase n=1 Tax=Aromatoleum petrolei TaxID=76116 RepID=A0ABX1MMG1_9RHOO|nr:PhnD/SsuA/transferrin family substrate-binding protein [Aromatoleum petrolei]NMF89132.1 PhnD/SsuA/transferrin family substrate-binding protein [Aromatoleum petrolei]QTQ36550.1 Two component system histidine kinase [Aromatoleum petrolei]